MTTRQLFLLASTTAPAAIFFACLEGDLGAIGRGDYEVRTFSWLACQEGN